MASKCPSMALLFSLHFLCPTFVPISHHYNPRPSFSLSLPSPTACIPVPPGGGPAHLHHLCRPRCRHRQLHTRTWYLPLLIFSSLSLCLPSNLFLLSLCLLLPLLRLVYNHQALPHSLPHIVVSYSDALPFLLSYLSDSAITPRLVVGVYNQRGREEELLGAPFTITSLALLLSLFFPCATSPATFA
jgi:hypothetical protein